MLQSYVPILILFGISVLTAVGMVVASHFMGPLRPTTTKGAPYESGMIPLGSARERFSVKFYLVAMLFILFDVEAVFLYPWAVLLKELKMFGFWEMLVYIGIVMVGLFYVWNKGVLDWSVAEPSSAPGTAALIPAPAEVHPETAALTAPVEGSRS
jgi:NADH-quinone oxidoreductase subunit A